MARFIIGEFDEAQAAGPMVGEAYYQLGMRYASGKDVPCDYVVAHKWFNLAAMHGCERARDERKALAEEMSREEISEAQRLAREWIRSLH